MLIRDMPLPILTRNRRLERGTAFSTVSYGIQSHLYPSHLVSTVHRSMSSSSSSTGQASLGQVAEKLTRTNYVLWRTQITPQLIGAGVFGYIDGSMAEPAEFVVSKDKDGKEETIPDHLHLV